MTDTIPTLHRRRRDVVVLMADRPDGDVQDESAFQVNLDYTTAAMEAVQTEKMEQR